MPKSKYEEHSLFLSNLFKNFNCFSMQTNRITNFIVFRSNKHLEKKRSLNLLIMSSELLIFLFMHINIIANFNL
uniref:Uncharacterized protein n=1 Tax=Setaria italica TaxID=4555 RepID=K3XNZ0_SETIT